MVFSMRARLLSISLMLVASGGAHALTENAADIEIRSSVTNMAVTINPGGSGCSSGQEWDTTLGRCTVALPIDTESSTSYSSSSCGSGYTGTVYQSQTCTKTVYGWRTPPSGVKKTSYYGSWSCGSWTTYSGSCTAVPPPPPPPPSNSGQSLTVTAFICGSYNPYFSSGAIISYANKMKIINTYNAFSYGGRCPEYGGYVWWQSDWTNQANIYRANNPGASMDAALDATWAFTQSNMYKAATENGEGSPTRQAALDEFCTGYARTALGSATLNAYYVTYSGDTCRVY